MSTQNRYTGLIVKIGSKMIGEETLSKFLRTCVPKDAYCSIKKDEMEKLIINANLQIAKPPSVVFEAIINPESMKGYFISESTGRMEAGAQLNWRFPEFDMDCPVRVGAMEQDKLISFYWDIDDLELLTEIKLEPAADHSTVVRITEGERANDEAGIKWLKGNTEGWTNFLACLKAYLEYGINLRTGGFDYMRK